MSPILKNIFFLGISKHISTKFCLKKSGLEKIGITVLSFIGNCETITVNASE